jgi:hypothetical protein
VADDQSLIIKDVRIQNAGWRLVNLTPEELATMPSADTRIRGYKLEKKNTLTIDGELLKEAGRYELNSEGLYKYESPDPGNNEKKLIKSLDALTAGARLSVAAEEPTRRLISQLGEDLESEQRVSAASQLATPSPEDTQIVVAALVKALKEDTDADVRAKAADSLNKIGTLTVIAVEALKEIANNKNEAPQVRAEAIAALAKTTPQDNTIVNIFTKLAAEDSSIVVRTAARSAISGASSAQGARLADASRVLLAVHMPEGETQESFAPEFADFQQKALKVIGKDRFDETRFEVRFFKSSTSRESIVDVTKERNTLVLDQSLFGKEEKEILNDVGVAYAVTLNSLDAKAFTLTLPFIDRLTTGRISELNEAELGMLLSVISAHLAEITPESRGRILRTSLGPVLNFGGVIVKNGERFVPDVKNELDHLMFEAAISRTAGDRAQAAGKLNEFNKGLLDHLALRLEISGKTAVISTLQSLATTRPSSRFLELLKVDPSYRDESLANVPAAPAPVGEKAKTILISDEVFLKEAEGVAIVARLAALKRRAPGQFRSVLHVDDEAYAAMDPKEAHAAYLAAHAQASVFDDIIFDARTRDVARLQAVHADKLGEKFILLADENKGFMLGEVDRSEGKAAYLVNLSAEADNTIGLVEFAAGYLLKPGQVLPNYVKMTIGGVLVYLRRIAPEDYKKVIEEIQVALVATGAAA